ncbi:hypothetical protein F5B20DRAFT_551031 [Whalleya microplaca]|nr:hypothetical protein F5B20DRAFT_551031 [Whalleya microplaca]
MEFPSQSSEWTYDFVFIFNSSLDSTITPRLFATKHRTTKSMSFRAFSTASRNLVRWLGYDRRDLPQEFRGAIEKYSENGAVKKVGEIDSIEIL